MGTSPATLKELRLSDGAIPRFELEAWRTRFGVAAGVTGSAAGDFGLASEDSTKRVLDRWSHLARDVAPGFSTVVVSGQVHGRRVGYHSSAVDGLVVQRGLDGHVTDVAGMLLAVTVADCVPVYLVHPGSGTIGLLHAGWRGVAAGILERGIQRMAGVHEIPPADLVMHCGVSICGDCYEVGAEVLSGVTGARVEGPGLLDLRANLVRRAERLGLESITSSEWCSAHDRGRFFSHRASGGSAGRMVAYIGRPST